MVNKWRKELKKTVKSEDAQNNIIEITTTPSSDVRLKIQREIARLSNIEGLMAPLSARDTLINYADVIEVNVIYLAEIGDPRLQPVIDSNIELAAKIRYWMA